MGIITGDLGKASVTVNGVHDDNTEYEKLCVVSANGISYISKKSVPIGINLGNTDYWMPLTDDTAAAGAAAAAAIIAKNAIGYIAEVFDVTKNYSAGDFTLYSGMLYKFVANHAAGEWDEEDVVEVILGDDLEDLHETLNNFIDDQASIGDTDKVWSADKLAKGQTYVTPEMYGAVGDGTTDDSDAFQDMFDAIGDNTTIVLSRQYLLEDTLTLTRSNVAITGMARGENNPAIITTLDAGNLITITGYGVRFSHISFRRRPQETSTSLDWLYYDAYNDVVNGNIDAEIDNCVIGYGRYGVKVRGRNIRIHDTLFQLNAIAIHLEQTEATDDNRGYEITNNRFHWNFVCVNNDINTDGTNRNILIQDNFCDGCRTLFQGYGGGVVVKGNAFYKVSTVSAWAVNVKKDTSDIVNAVIDNVFYLGGISQSGITIGSGCNALVKNNILLDAKDNAIYSIGNTDIIGNTVTNTDSSSAILVTGKSTIMLNVLRNCNVGIGLGGSSSGICIFNTYDNCTTEYSNASANMRYVGLSDIINT